MYAYLGYIYRWLILYFTRHCLLSSFDRSLTADSFSLSTSAELFAKPAISSGSSIIATVVSLTTYSGILELILCITNSLCLIQTSPLLSVDWSGTMELNPSSKCFGIFFFRSLLRIGSSSVTLVTGYLRLLVGGTSLLTSLIVGANTRSDVAGGHWVVGSLVNIPNDP